MLDQKTNEIIVRLKEIRRVKGYTYQKIYEMVEESGGAVSLATIKRVFSDGSENKNFRYDDSIRPIVAALIGESPIEAEDGQPMTDAALAANTLRSISTHKDDIITELRREHLRLQEEADRKDKHIVALTAQINRKDKAIFWLVVFALALAVLIISALIIDRINPNLGYFWRDVSAILTGNSPMKNAGSSADIGTMLNFIRR